MKTDAQPLSGAAAWLEPRRALPLLFGLALLLRLIYLLEIRDTPLFLAPQLDARMYLDWAGEILRGDWSGANRPVFYLGPLYPYSLAALFALTGGPSILAATLLQVLLSALTVAAIYWIALRAFDRPVALLAGLLAAVYRPYIFYSGVTLAATHLLLLHALTLVCVLEGLHRKRLYWWLLAGLALGLAGAVRGTALLYGPMIGIVLMLKHGWRVPRQWAPPLAAAGAACILAILPITLHNLVHGRTFVPLTANLGANLYIGNHTGADGIYQAPPVYNGRNLGVNVVAQNQAFPAVARAELHNPGADPATVSSFWVGRTVSQIADAPGAWLGLMARKARYALNAWEIPNNRNLEFSKRFSILLRLPLMTWGLLLPLAVFGLVVTRGRWRQTSPLWGHALVGLLALVAFFVTARHRLPMTVALFPFAAAALLHLRARILARDIRHLRITVSLLAVGLLAVYWPPRPVNMLTNVHNLGVAMQRLERHEEALEQFDAVLRQTPDFYRARIQRGESLLALGRREEAAHELSRAAVDAMRQGDPAAAAYARRQAARAAP